MLGLKEICGLAFLFGWHSVALPTPIPKQPDECLKNLKNKSEKLFIAYKSSSKVHQIIHLYNNNTELLDAFRDVPDCSGKPNTNLSMVADFNTLFIAITDLSERWKPAEIELLTVIGLQCICLKNHTEPKTDNLTIHWKGHPDDIVWDVTFYLIFERFNVCMQQL